MIDHHIWRLRNRHKDISRILREEMRKTTPDPLIVEDLTERKAQVEAELARLGAPLSLLVLAGPSLIAQVWPL